jgi:hypothetical protein
MDGDSRHLWHHRAMTLLLLLLSAPVSAGSASPELTYVGPPAYGDGPKWTGKADPMRTQITHFDAGSTLHVATANANLRAGPSTSEAVVAKLPMGADVRIVDAVTMPVVVGQRVDCWYEVETNGKRGFLFGSTLTPLAARLDLDGQPGDEWITVSWAWDFELIVRTGPADGRSEAEHRSSFGGDRKGGRARLRTLPERGAAVVEVDLGSDSAQTTTWFHAMTVEDGAPVERASTYAHDYEGGTKGFLAFDAAGTVCSAFASRDTADACVELRTGTARKEPAITVLREWTRIPGP